MLEGRSVRANRGANILKLIQQGLDDDEEEVLGQLDAERDGDEDDDAASAKAPGSDRSFRSQDIKGSSSDSFDSDFGSEEDTRQLSSESSAEDETKARREDRAAQKAQKQAIKAKAHSAAVKDGASTAADCGGAAKVRLRKPSALSQEERMRRAKQYAIENEAKLIDQERRFADKDAMMEGQLASMLALRSKRRRQQDTQEVVVEQAARIRYHSSARLRNATGGRDAMIIAFDSGAGMPDWMTRNR